MFLIAFLPGGDRYDTVQKLFTAQYVPLLLVAFMHMTERLMYRMWHKRQSRAQTQKR